MPVRISIALDVCPECGADQSILRAIFQVPVGFLLVSWGFLNLSLALFFMLMASELRKHPEEIAHSLLLLTSIPSLILGFWMLRKPSAGLWIPGVILVLAIHAVFVN